MTRFEKQQLEQANIREIIKFFCSVSGPRYSFHSYSLLNNSTPDSNFILPVEPGAGAMKNAQERATALAQAGGGWIIKVTTTTMGDETRLEIASYHPKNPATCVEMTVIRHECEEGLEDQADCAYCDSLYWIGAKRAEAQAEDGHGFYSGAA